MRGGMLLRVIPVRCVTGSRWPGRFAVVGEAGDGEEKLADPVPIASVHGVVELPETRVEPVRRHRGGQQAGDGRVFGPPDLFVGLPQVFRELLAGPDTDDLDRDVHVDIGHPRAGSSFGPGR